MSPYPTFLVYRDVLHRDLHSFPTRRSSDLRRRDTQRDGVGARTSNVHRVVQPLAGVDPADVEAAIARVLDVDARDRKSTRLNSSHVSISYAVFCLKKKTRTMTIII